LAENIRLENVKKYKIRDIIHNIILVITLILPSSFRTAGFPRMSILPFALEILKHKKHAIFKVMLTNIFFKEKVVTDNFYALHIASFLSIII